MTIRTTYRDESPRTRASRKNARRVFASVSFSQVGRGVPAEPCTSALATSHQPQATSQPPAQPALLASYVYAPFGAVTSSSGTFAAANPFRFSSEYADDTLALVYYNYRHYNPTDGRWTSRELLGEGRSRNLLAYSQNQTLSLIDQYGLCVVVMFPPAGKWPSRPQSPSVIDQFGWGTSPFSEEKWFERRFPGVLRFAREQFTKEINGGIDCKSEAFFGPNGKSRRISIDQTEACYGDEEEDWWESNAQLGAFALDYVTPVMIRYYDCTGNEQKYSWTTTMYVEDCTGTQPDDKWVYEWFGWCTPSRRVIRARWQLTGNGTCKCR